MIGRFWRRARILLYQFLQVFNSCFQLRVMSIEGRIRQIVHDYIRIDTVTLDKPLPLWRVYADLRSRSDTSVRQLIRRRQPNLTAPGPVTNDFSKAQHSEALRKALAVARRVFIHKDD